MPKRYHVTTADPGDCCAHRRKKTFPTYAEASEYFDGICDRWEEEFGEVKVDFLGRSRLKVGRAWDGFENRLVVLRA